MNTQTDILFVSEKPVWPLDQGFRIRGYHMAMALRRLGVRVALASMKAPPIDAPEPLREMIVPWPDATTDDTQRFRAGWSGPAQRLRHRLARCQGLSINSLAGVVPLINQLKPETVVGLGQHSTAMLRGLSQYQGLKRVWYAADELLHFQLSCLRREGFRALPQRLRLMALYGALETCFVRGIDGAVGVNPTDTRLLRRIAGARHTATIRNGVNTDFFHPPTHAEQSTADRNNQSIVFWGRLDFEPNIDAVTWFADKVWPGLHQAAPDAVWHIVGKNPTRQVCDLQNRPGIRVVGPVDDLRTHAWGSAVTVLPMRCGGGIKNKLLEAAAMARPIVASPKAAQGLVFDRAQPPLALCTTPESWIKTISNLWNDQPQRDALGQRALAWVKSHHTWEQAARSFLTWIDALPAAGVIGRTGVTAPISGHSRATRSRAA